MTRENILRRAFLPLFLLVLLSLSALGQVPVSLSPVARQQFFSSNGIPLASGRVYTYIAGTTTQSNTYIDSTGGPQNTDPIILDAGGFADIWLGNQAYKFIVQDSNGVQQWSADNITGYLGLLNLANTWTFQQTFTLPIIDLSTDNQFVVGAPGNQTTLDFPPAAGNIALHFPATNDTMVGRDTTDNLNNKTLASPTITTPTVNGTKVVNTPGAYFTIANQNPTGTTVNTLTKLANAPSQAIIAAITDTGGVVGIAVSGAGATGNVTIQSSGQSSCVFDGATTAGDYVQISATTAGNCHDSGTSPAGGNQAIGRVLSTNGGGGTYSIDLFGPEIRQSVTTICAFGGAATVNPAGVANTAIESCSFPAGALNQVKKSFRLTALFNEIPAGAYVVSAAWGMGSTSALATTANLYVTSATAGTYWTYLSLTCTVGTAGASGTIFCTPTTNFLTSGAGTFTPSVGVTGVTGIDLTGVVYVGTLCAFGTGNASNACSDYQLTVEQLN